MSRGLFYITTPIFYVNDKPHLGTAYSAITADILRRFHRLFGSETFFLTGTDEHGQKAFEAARARGLSPEEHCAETRALYIEAWKKLHIDVDFGGAEAAAGAAGGEGKSRFRRGLFFYTSHKYRDESQPDRTDHTKAVQKALRELYDKGDIYSGSHKGWYCVSEEAFYTEKDLVDGKSPSGREVIPLEEKGYFFKMSKYQNQLNEHLKSHPQFIRPAHRQNEIKGFLRKPLRDLCVSRPKKRVSWGIELPFDSNYVTYVWVDALLNYINGVGYGSALEEDVRDFKKWWRAAGAVHLIGKDILITHGVYWPCLLMALGLPLPKAIAAHGWLLNKSREKMSKSGGERLDPLELAEELGVSELRYFLARDIPLGNDAFISKERMIQRIHQDLSDQSGNLLSRLTRLAETGFEGKVPLKSALFEAAQIGGQMEARQIAGAESLKALTEKTVSDVERKIRDFQLSQALESVDALLAEVNRFLEGHAPWKLIKTDKEAAGRVLAVSLEALRISGVLLFPVMPGKMEDMLKILGAELPKDGLGPGPESLKWGGPPGRAKGSQKIIKQPPPLFPKS